MNADQRDAELSILTSKVVADMCDIFGCENLKEEHSRAYQSIRDALDVAADLDRPDVLGALQDLCPVCRTTHSPETLHGSGGLGVCRCNEYETCDVCISLRNHARLN